MGRIFAFVFLSFASFDAVADAAADAADAAAARRLETALAGLDSLRAEFRQTVTDARGRVTESAEGTVSLARPGRFRWDYRTPEQLIVSDGTTVWFYDVGLEQVTIRRAADTIEGTPAMLLSGEGDLATEFEIADGGAGGGIQWVLLRPRGEASDFRELRVGLERDELRRMTLLDRLGQTTQLEFDRIERNPRFDRDDFRFTPPAGVDVVGRDPAGAS